MLFLFIVRLGFVDYELDYAKPAWLNFMKVETSLHFGVYYIADVVQQQQTLVNGWHVFQRRL